MAASSAPVVDDALVEASRRDAREGRIYTSRGAALTKERGRIRMLLHQYNFTDGESQIAKEVLAQILPNVNVHTCTIVPPFQLHYGNHILVGERTFINFNATFADQGVITIGNDVLIGPNCAFYTPNHPVDPEERRSGVELASPITIEDDVWIGGSVTVRPGITIGRGSTIGAGSVVVRSIPPYCVAVGNPCKVVKRLSDRTTMQSDGCRA